ncbi:ATP-dependent helicase [Cytobacillus kochii]|uniref:ATP-dependent helicase n=1 Tax=Cytobacillus kochii TaxID=859143 RepID=UPI00247FA86E|nr:ATP-dependent helicase [Cytobacillus kochii]
MKSARLMQERIQLHTLKRSDYPFIHEEGKRGNLYCTHCGENVLFYLGIQDEPNFYHSNEKECEYVDEIIPKATEKTKEKEVNGFRLPQGRSILEEVEKPFKTPVRIENIPPFAENTVSQASPTEGYLRSLEEHGISFDHDQKRAVTYCHGPLLVLAGAGSGKTRVLTGKTAYLFHEYQVDPRSVLLVTFTAKAANEMKQRIKTYPYVTAKHINQMVCGTFHSIFYRILSFHDHNNQKWDHRYLLKNWQKEQMIKQSARALHIDEKDFPFDMALQLISFWKNSLQSPTDVRATDSWEEKVQQMYQAYEEEKQRLNTFDFDDMLSSCYELFKKNPQILAQYQKRFKYILIDEFQDVNKVQFELLRMLVPESEHICAVGDDDQSIYAFRGSDPSYLTEFEQMFDDSFQITLQQNYRSSHEITAFASQVIKKNKRRKAKNMVAQFKNEAYPTLFYPYDEEEEALIILTDIQERIRQGHQPNDFAILYRTHSTSRALFERFTRSNIPFKIEQDAESFYDRFIIRTLLSFLRLAINEEDAQALKDILPALFLTQSHLQDMKANSILHDCSLLECLSMVQSKYAFQQSKAKKTVTTIKAIKQLSPLLALEKIEKELQIQDFIKKRGNEGNKMDKGSEDLKELKLIAKKFTTLLEFIEYADHMRAKIKEMKQISKTIENAVTFSTIHKAKGLEYPFVYILSVVDGSLPHDYALEEYRTGTEQSLEEERRLLYVAMTRAKEQLHLSLLQHRKGKKAYPSRFLPHIKNTIYSK